MESIANLITDSHESLARSVAEGFAGVDKRMIRVEHKLGIDFKKPQHV